MNTALIHHPRSLLYFVTIYIAVLFALSYTYVQSRALYRAAQNKVLAHVKAHKFAWHDHRIFHSEGSAVRQTSDKRHISSAGTSVLLRTLYCMVCSNMCYTVCVVLYVYSM